MQLIVRSIAFSILFFCLPLVANAQYSISYWDSVLSNKNYYDPVPNHLIYELTTATGLNNPAPLGTLVTWAFSPVVNGQWTGTAYGTTYRAGNYEYNPQTLVGNIDASGNWKILFTNDNSGKVVIGIGSMELYNGVWSPVAQTFSTGSVFMAHWAYNVPYDPNVYTPLGAQYYQVLPSITSPGNAWIEGTTWKITNKSFFGSNSSGTVTFSNFNNGYIWGLGKGPVGSVNTVFSSLATVTPYGKVLLGLLNNGQLNVMWGTLTSNPFASTITLADYGYGTTTGTPNGDISSLSYTSPLGMYTNSSLQQTATALQGQFGAQQNAVVAGLSYDCNLFGANNVCVSAGGRDTLNSDPNINAVSALLIGAYRIKDGLRVGAYLDQNLSASNPNGITSMGNNTPMGGLFGVWSDKSDGTGAEVKASLGYNNKSMTVARPVIGLSESGSGGTNLTSQGAVITAKYGLGVGGKTIVSPYIGMRYMTTKMGGYSEGVSNSVQYPLSYSNLSMDASTALAGMGASYKLDEQWSFSGSAGVEMDTQTSVGSYTVSNYTGLTPVALNSTPNNVRPAATLAAYYMVDMSARLGLITMYRQDSFTGMSSTTGLVTYTMGL
ncbi:MAG: autotransporter outer membrane beta-barrel domain-containing protein [Polynucleobacter sp.]|uniref:autotransporter outer membrane beta-barrel domain-containing protein n=1 Tax=Polynucleobacter sp. TaxID=2029855 RepID=UPI0027282714|nr:autotransporter outer membrane beta-barrel domain-containing protein [Polynucleobacter sp.]MDO8713237.1 autotransporter outer membrane beta-barrel domain-containing protein [Polynucleobacter sp.]